MEENVPEMSIKNGEDSLRFNKHSTMPRYFLKNPELQGQRKNTFRKYKEENLSR